ncbi:shikimate dehydrogenase [Candidatus Halobonum tyrrellensis]|uniref:Shikimate dehydrogenase (NADP(+)) n=1 Tax=Candidatus Halobonum tyrrellensis G22 TaxID=1324957 RepID=V4GNM1_9EURY|nr:shikimate dehydrogenase [Candidatus Halobonum tyrrellensis]ESP86991.1 shikimate 5-dehydrogenase [Candidatus Halobonum tyrrellensis G22]
MDVYGIIGNPVEHSLSPPMHEAAFEERGIDAAFVTFEADPDRIGEAFAGAEALGVDGLTVTLPFKGDALEFSEPDDRARRVGAVNTVDFATDPPTGHNYDLSGAVRAFDHHDVSLDGARTVVVGAGGAARALAFGFEEAGAEVAVANRTESKAHALADDVPGASGHGLDDLPDLMADADVVANATSVGLESDESVAPADAWHADQVAFDAVYTPLETRFLRDAADAGAETIDGAWMLLFQGVEAFETWTGVDAPVEAMDDALRERLAE